MLTGASIAQMQQSILFPAVRIGSSAEGGMPMDLGIKGKCALITGASKGLGRAIAEELAKEGAHVSMCARGKEELERTAQLLRAHGVTVASIAADVAKAALTSNRK